MCSTEEPRGEKCKGRVVRSLEEAGLSIPEGGRAWAEGREGRHLG